MRQLPSAFLSAVTIKIYKDQKELHYQVILDYQVILFAKKKSSEFKCQN